MWQHAVEGRPVRAYIDLAAFRHNIEIVTKHCPNSQLYVVVKADAYGHGMAELARQAPSHNLAVASIDEADHLREEGISNPILILEGPFDHHCLNKAAEKNYLLLVHGQWQLDLMAQWGKQLDQPIKVWLKIDTGMHRLGLEPKHAVEAVKTVKTTPGFEFMGLATHLACADNPESPLSSEQVKQLELTASALGLADDQFCIANSGGILHFPESHRGWVRPGIMLYGGAPHDTKTGMDYGLKPVMSLKSAIIALRIIESGESVGYGHTWTASKKSVIATIAVGYADGYPRHAPSGTPLLVRGQQANLAGRVSMDMIAADVTDIKDVAIGDEVELWGTNIHVDTVAQSASTISYDLMTGVTKRVPRIYLNGIDQV